MKKLWKNKVLSLFVVVAVAFSFLAPLNLKLNFARAEESQQETVVDGYYKSKLSDDAKKFYNAISKMQRTGLLQTSGNLDLIKEGVLTEKDVKNYAKGDDAKLEAFYDARDAYSLDHPEVFYVDYSELSINFTKKSNGSYSAVLGAGRNVNYFADGFNAELVETSLEFFNSADGFAKLLPTETTLTSVQKIEYVNSKIVEVAEKTGIVDSAKDTVNSSYGIVKHGKALSEGYAKTFKLCMDKLEIPCVVVNGYLASENNFSFEVHSWNMVKVDGEWFVVDSFLNDNGVNTEEWLLVGENKLNERIIKNNVVSEYGKVFETPELEKSDIGGQNLSVDVVEIDDEKFVSASFNGMNAKELAELENKKYLAVVFGCVQNGNIFWNSTLQAFSTEEEMNKEGYSLIVYEQPEFFNYVKVYLTSKEPTSGLFYDGLEDSEIEQQTILIESKEVVNENKPVVEIKNKATGEVVPAGVLDVNEAYSIKLTYASKLVEKTNVSNVAVNIVSTVDENISIYSNVSNVVFDGDKTVSFDFKASQLFKHKSFVYNFYITNLISAETYAEPESFSVRAERKDFELSHIYDISKITADECKKPTLFKNQKLDIELGDWEDSHGEGFDNYEKSLMTLVSNDPTELQAKSMKETLADDVVASSLFNLTLFIGEEIPKIKAESYYVNMILPYPERTSYESNLKFEIVEFRKDVNGEYDYSNPVVRNCIPTENGLLVSTDYLGLCMVVATKPSAQDVKTVYASVVALGGSVEADSVLQSKCAVQKVEDTITYKIKLDDSYRVDYILLNGKDITSKLSSDGKLTLNASDLKTANIIEFGLASGALLEAEKEAKTVSLEKEFMIATNPENKDVKSKSYLWIVFVALGALALVSGIVVKIVVKKKKGTTKPVQEKEVKKEAPKAEKEEVKKVESEKVVVKEKSKKIEEKPKKQVASKIKKVEAKKTEKQKASKVKNEAPAKPVPSEKPTSIPKPQRAVINQSNKSKVMIEKNEPRKKK